MLDLEYNPQEEAIVKCVHDTPKLIKKTKMRKKEHCGMELMWYLKNYV